MTPDHEQEGEQHRMYHDKVEGLLAKLRAANAAKDALAVAPIGEAGAVATFPAYLTAPALRGHGYHPWTVGLSHEPGQPFPAGITQVTYRAQIGRCAVRGSFPVCVGDGTPP